MTINSHWKNYSIFGAGQCLKNNLERLNTCSHKIILAVLAVKTKWEIEIFKKGEIFITPQNLNVKYYPQNIKFLSKSNIFYTIIVKWMG